MRRSLPILLALTIATTLTSCGITTIPPGYVGIRVNNVGSKRGIESTPIVIGRVFYNPFVENIYRYPTFAQNYIWTASSHEGKGHDESISFNAQGGISFNADVGVVLKIDADKVPMLFGEYRRPIEELIDGVIRNEVRDAFNRAAGALAPLDILATKKAALLDRVKADLNAGPLAAKGIEFQTVSFVNSPRPDSQVQNSINQVFQQNQLAMQAQQKVAQATAEANQAIASARGDSASNVIRANGAAEANRRLSASLTPAVVQWQYLARWNGVLPYVTGGNAALVQLPVGPSKN